jgi:hypothetical protein
VRVGRGDLAEQPGESDLLRVPDLLVAEEDHLVPEQGGPDLGRGGGVEPAAQVHAGDLGPDVARGRRDVQAGERLRDGHDGSSPS